MEMWQEGRELVIPGRLSWEEANQRMSYYIAVRAQLPKVIGQLCVYIDEKWHESGWQIISRLYDEGQPYQYSTIRQYMSLWRKFGQEWDTSVKISLYQAVEGLPKDKAQKLIDRARELNLTRQEVRAMAQNGKNGAGSTLGNGAAMAQDRVSAQMAHGSEEPPTALAQAKENLGLQMAVCGKLIQFDDDENLKEALDDLIAKGLVLRGMLV